MTPAELAAANTRMVYAIANEVAVLLGDRDRSELVGDGMVGLMQAANRFDPSRFDGPFATYAKQRVRGAMVDGFRRRNRTGYNHSSGERVVFETIDTTDRQEGEWDRLGSVQSAEDAVLDRFALATLLETISEMPPHLREMVGVVASGGKFAPLAERDGVTQAAISHRLARARRWIIRGGRPPSGPHSRKAA